MLTTHASIAWDRLHCMLSSLVITLIMLAHSAVVFVWADFAVVFAHTDSTETWLTLSTVLPMSRDCGLASIVEPVMV